MVLVALVLIFALELLFLVASSAARRRHARRGRAAGTNAPHSSVMEQLMSLRDGPETEHASRPNR